jgi:Recombination endonuclease VII
MMLYLRHVEVPSKRCRKCKQLFSVSEFDLSKDQRDGLYPWCKTCKKPKQRTGNIDRLKRWETRQDPTHIKKIRNRTAKLWNLMRYGLTFESYDELLEAQGGFCKLCKDRDKCGRMLSVDHNHVTGEVRGLLCTFCNTALGMLRDNPELIDRMKIYLETNGTGVS